MTDNVVPNGTKQGSETTATPPPGGKRPLHERVSATLIANAPIFAAVITAGAFVVIIGSIFAPFVNPFYTGVQQPILLRELADKEIARGLITFLIAISTVGIALVLTVYAVVTPDQKAKENFAMAKEVLSALVGILGTIVGFYFGSATTPPAQQPPVATVQMAPIKVTNVKIDPAMPKLDDKVRITADIVGGTPPYDYSISFKPDSIKKVDNKGSKGTINEFVAFPTDKRLKPGTEFEVALKITDQAGVSVDAVNSGKFKIGQ